MNSLLFWFMLMFLLYFAYMLGARRGTASSGTENEEAPEPQIPPDTLARVQGKLSPIMGISGRKSRAGTIQFEGKLHGRSDTSFAEIRKVLAAENVSPLLLEGDGKDVRVVLMPAKAESATDEKSKWWLHWLLFVLTIATTTWAGALHTGVNLLQQPERFVVGLPYSLGLLLILGAHELGHYFTARYHGIRVTPPYFIPVPFALGTFGAFIKVKSITPNRRALFDMAVAGPLAGLVFAIPALLIGLGLSKIAPDQTAETVHTGVEVGSSIIMAILAKISLGASVLDGHRLLLHPLAFAGWLGLMVTALNLLPIGQLDRGHIAHAMFGSRKGHTLSVVALVSLFALALFVWPGLMMWALIVFLLAGTRAMPAADDVTPMEGPRKLVGYFTFLLLALILLPVPHSLYEAIGIHCPYL